MLNKVLQSGNYLQKLNCYVETTHTRRISDFPPEMPQYHVPGYTCGGQKTTFRSQLYLFTMWDLGIHLFCLVCVESRQGLAIKSLTCLFLLRLNGSTAGHTSSFDACNTYTWSYNKEKPPLFWETKILRCSKVKSGVLMRWI